MPEQQTNVDCILQIALPLPLPQLFDYFPPSGLDYRQLEPGQRLLVPFGPRELVGVLVKVSTGDAGNEKTKAALALLDQRPSLTEELQKLCMWASNYYHHPVGEVLSSALPKRYRKPEQREELRSSVWVHTTEGLGLPEGALKRSKKQQALHQFLLEHKRASKHDCLKLDISNSVCKAMEAKGLIEEKRVDEFASFQLENILACSPLELNQEQALALNNIRYHQFQCSLLQGITGSGKTEVYLQLIARVLQSGKQALVLIPEIGLTPQTLQRFRERFHVEIAELHSKVSEVERARNWEKAKAGVARIIIGTRLAALTPVHDLGVIIIDEEHDPSFKQQDGFRYSARDISIYRAHQLNIPIILGSATPSLESLHNALKGRYTHLSLTSRAGLSRPPQMQTVDLRNQSLKAGLSHTVLERIKASLAKGKQALVFLNRRGYAPLLFCESCGWHARCPSCELNLTLHQSPPRLHCHHCDTRRAIPVHCPTCKNINFQHSGAGTEQVVELLRGAFSDTPIIQIDRDTTRNKDGMEKMLSQANLGEPCILVGTQMLAKGHHLKALDLVVVMDTDQGLMSPDYKALERLGQLITQVAGRAGREEDVGTVLLQSFQPEHPMLQTLIHEGYDTFAKALLEGRRAAALPPFSYSALFRAESKRGENAVELLALIKRELVQLKANNKVFRTLKILGPFPAAMEKLNHRYRFQLQLYCSERPVLHSALACCLEKIYQNALSRRTRWSLDIDPVEHI